MSTVWPISNGRPPPTTSLEVAVGPSPCAARVAVLGINEIDARIKNGK